MVFREAMETSEPTQDDLRTTSSTILARFGERVAESPDAPLLLGEGNQFTRLDLFQLTRRVAKRLGDLRLPPSTSVALVAENGPAFLAGLLAIQHLSLTTILVDAGTPDEELYRIVRKLGAGAALKADLRWSTEVSRWKLLPLPDPITVPRPNGRPCVIKLTSGSSGDPRGIVVSEDALLNDARALVKAMGFHQEDRLLAAIPLSHSYGLSVLALPSLVYGFPLLIPSGWDPLTLARNLGASVFPTVPAYLQGLLALSTPPPMPKGLRRVISAGAPLPRSVAQDFLDRFGRHVHVFYGASECGGISYDPIGTSGLRGTVGPLIEGVDVHFVKEGKKTPNGTSTFDMISVTSSSVGDRYFPEEDSRLDENRFLTSDQGSLQDGELVLQGRAGNFVNIKGKKVLPDEVEAVLALHPQVREAIVVALGSKDKSQALRAIIACPKNTVSYRTLIEWCRPRLCAHKIPRSFVFVDEIPRTPRGKVDRSSLARVDPA